MTHGPGDSASSGASSASGVSVLANVDSALVEHFGHRALRASVSFVGVDPIEVLRFEPIPGERAFVTLGMALHPMTSSTSDVLATDGPRAELLLHVHDETDEFSDVWRRLAVLAAAPAVEGVVYAPGMTVEIGEPLVAGSACVGVVITESPLAAIATGAGTVDVFQAVPATSTELAWCRVRGSEALLDRWREQDVDRLDLTRRAVRLD